MDIARFDIGAGIERAGFLSNPCVWFLNGSRAADTALWLFVPDDGCGRRVAGSVFGLGLIIRACLDRSH